MSTVTYPKLRGRIVEKFGTNAKFAEHINITQSALSRKLRGERGFTKKEIISFCDALDIGKQEIGDYFF